MNSISEIRKKACTIIKDTGSFLQQETNKHISSNLSLYNSNRNEPIIKTKSSSKDLVTWFDIEVENRLKEQLYAILPGSSFLAEETADSTEKSDKLWIIDPIDGTTNFYHQLPFYCISVALQIEESLKLGFVYNPVMNEFFEAQESQGSLLNGKNIRVSSVKTIDSSLLATGFAYNFSETTENNINYFKHFQSVSHGIRRLGSAALDICYVAKGCFDGFWELYLKPWDVAAAILIIQEAGGQVTNFSGKPYSFDNDNILATNSHIHQEMLNSISSI